MTQDWLELTSGLIGDTGCMVMYACDHEVLISY